MSHVPSIVLKELRLDQVDAIGFDMDETLAIYRRETFQKLTIANALEKLAARGYAPDVVELAYDLELGMRGLLIDRRRGNVLKVRGDGSIERGYHGHRRLTDEELRTQYARDTEPRAGLAYFEVDTFFSMPISVIFSGLVEAMVAAGSAPRYHVLLRDAVVAVTDAIRDGNAARASGGRLDDCLEPDPGLRMLLETLRTLGKKLFLLTNSSWEYARRVMAWLLDDAHAASSWAGTFDAIVVDARKPGFFTENAPFAIHDPPAVLGGGDARALEAILGVSGDRILYVGDHPHEDVIVPKDSVGWHTAMIVPELGGAAADLDSRHWGHPLRGGEHPSAFYRRVEGHATLIAGRVSTLLRYFPELKPPEA